MFKYLKSKQNLIGNFQILQSVFKKVTQTAYLKFLAYELYKIHSRAYLHYCYFCCHHEMTSNSSSSSMGPRFCWFETSYRSTAE